MEIEYSDGKSTERHIVDTLKGSSELHSLSPIAFNEYASWPVRYHLCPERGHLLRHFDFSGLDVLELGAGMGGVSRGIAESCKSLTSVEGTSLRVEALRERLRDLKNWQAIVGNVQDLELDRKFDAVVIVGVLEYSELFVTKASGNPFVWFLENACRFLKDDGALILAIENKLGLKYWNAAAEDHTGRLFDGISGYSLSKSPRTFSRRELKDMLRSVGLSHTKDYFPFPDYKIPRAVLTETALETTPLAADLASHSFAENYMQPTVPLYPYRLALRSVAEAGLLADMSNSLLLVAGRSPHGTFGQLVSCESDGTVAWHYSSSVRKALTCTRFTRQAGQIFVSKALLDKTETVGKDTDAVAWNGVTSEPMAHGYKLNHLLLKHLYFGNHAEFSALFEDFIRWSLERWQVGDSLKGRALDAIVTNAVQTEDGGFALFDLEWELASPMPRSWFVFRNVYNFALDGDVQRVGLPTSTAARLYEELCKKLGIGPDLENDLSREAQIQALLSRNPADAQHAAELRRLLFTPLTNRLPRVPGDTVPLPSLGGFSRAKARLAKYPWLHATAKNVYHKVLKPWMKPSEAPA